MKKFILLLTIISNLIYGQQKLNFKDKEFEKGLISENKERYINNDNCIDSEEASKIKGVNRCV